MVRVIRVVRVIREVQVVRVVRKLRVVYMIREVRVVRDVCNYGMHWYAFGIQKSVPKSKKMAVLFKTGHRP